MITILRDLFGPGTWGAGGNLVAWALCGALGVAGAFLFRDKIGPALAGWWHKHHGEHSRADLEALEERLKAHVSGELARHRALTVPTEPMPAPGKRRGTARDTGSPKGAE